MNPNKALWEKGDFTRIAATMCVSEIRASILPFCVCARGLGTDERFREGE